jgi:hypothetical protein
LTNFTPLVLSVLGFVSSPMTITSGGMLIALCTDAYFGLRFKNDKIEFSPNELYCMESWTQEAFNKKQSLSLQITSAVLIFSELYFAILGTTQHSGFSKVMLMFVLLRLGMFLFQSVVVLSIL